MTFPQIDPVALSLGPLEIRWYALAYLAGFLLGWIFARRLSDQEPNRRPNKDDLDDLLTWIVLGVILGGRFGYVMFYNLDYYMERPADILKLWEGGMAFHGGLIGAGIAMWFYALRQKIPFFQVTDIVAVVAPIGLFFGRMANFINAELYGRVTTLPWGMAFPTAPDNYPRHPSQIYEALLEGLILFIVLVIAYNRPEIRQRPGLVTGSFLMGYAFFRFLVEYVRAPDPQLGFVLGHLTMGQILCLPMFALGAALIYWVRRRHGS